MKGRAPGGGKGDRGGLAFSNPGPDSLAPLAPVDVASRWWSPTRRAGRNLQPRSRRGAPASSASSSAWNVVPGLRFSRAGGQPGLPFFRRAIRASPARSLLLSFAPCASLATRASSSMTHSFSGEYADEKAVVEQVEVVRRLRSPFVGRPPTRAHSPLFSSRSSSFTLRLT